MNENNNRVKVAFSEEDFQEIIQTIEQLNTQLLPYRIGITPQERRSIPKINVSNKAFVIDALNEMQNTSVNQFMSSYLKRNDILADITMFEQTERITSMLKNLYQLSDDLRVMSGGEAYSSALAFKRMADSATQAGIPGAAAVSAKLKERFALNGKRKTKRSNDSTTT